MKEKRREIVKRRKNFLPTLILTLLLWTLVGGIIYFVDPQTPGIIILFFLVLLLVLLFTFSIVFTNTRRGFLAAFGLILFLLLRYFGIGNILNFLLIAGLIISIELYYTRR